MLDLMTKISAMESSSRSKVSGPGTKTDRTFAEQNERRRSALHSFLTSEWIHPKLQVHERKTRVAFPHQTPILALDDLKKGLLHQIVKKNYVSSDFFSFASVIPESLSEKKREEEPRRIPEHRIKNGIVPKNSGTWGKVEEAEHQRTKRRAVATEGQTRKEETYFNMEKEFKQEDNEKEQSTEGTGSLDADKLESNMQEIKKGFKVEIDEMTQKSQKLVTRIKKYQEEIESYREKEKNLEDLVQKEKEKNEEIRKEVEKLDAVLKLVDMPAGVKELEGEVGKLSQEIKEMETVLKGEKDENEDLINDYKRKLETKKLEKEELLEKIEFYEKELGSIDSRAVQNEEKAKVLGEDINKKKIVMNRSAYTNRIKELTANAKKMREETVKQRTELIILEDSLKKSRLVIENLNNEIEHLFSIEKKPSDTSKKVREAFLGIKEVRKFR